MADVEKILQMIDMIISEEIEDAILNSEDNIEMMATICTFMRRDLTRITDFFEVTVPLYLQSEFQNHFRMTRRTMDILCCEIISTVKIPNGNMRGRPPIPPEKQVLVFVWCLANQECARSVADRFNITMSSVSRVLHRGAEALMTLSRAYIKWPNGR